MIEFICPEGKSPGLARIYSWGASDDGLYKK
jgi:hypothetical protein